MSVGDAGMDRQHKRLFELCWEAEQLTEDMADFSERYHILLDELCRYAEQHFMDEEKMLQEAGYPDFHAHKKEHDEYFTSLSEILFNATKGKYETEKLRTFLSAWLIDHIQNSDMKYKDYLATNKEKRAPQ